MRRGTFVLSGVRACARFLVHFLFVLIPFTATDAFAGTPADTGVLQVFVREGCPHCSDAKRFLADLVRERPGLVVVYREVDRDPLARDELIELSRASGIWPPSVPTFVHQGQVLVGFDDATHSGVELQRLIGDAGAVRDTVRGTFFGTLSASELGLPLFTIAIGLLDGFNPCAMWVLLFLLALLVRLGDRRRMAAVAGTFVIASGLVYFLFLAAWLNVFLFIGMTEAVRIALALIAILIGLVNVKDFAAFGRGPSLSIPDSAKPGIYARVRGVIGARSLPASLVGVAVLAVLVNFVELLCTAGLPAIYTAVLTQHGLSAGAHYAYLGLYILAYIADDALMVTLAVLALGSGKLGERGGRLLKLLSGAVMLLLGTIMLLRPDLLI